jgi:cellulose synthase/poly-beta-1,6-N-acetylglucosamine synthase-like glycosyltransferase
MHLPRVDTLAVRWRRLSSKQMPLLIVSLFVFIVFFNRYAFGIFLKRMRGAKFEAVNPGFEPEVTVIIPSYNEGSGIYGGIVSILDQDYPPEKLNVYVVDDCSKDDSLEWACNAAEHSPSRVTILRHSVNVGKRLGILNAVRKTYAEIIVSVDSDVILEGRAIRQLVSRFCDKTIAAVGGRVCVENASENWLTRMQTIKYYYGYELFKNVERVFNSVLCLSGCLTAYRRSVLIELESVLESRSVLGVPIKYGEDRFLTRQIVKAGYKTFLTLEAVCWTVVPNTMTKFWSQQLRWRRSVIIDFFGGVSHVWKLHPFVTLNYAAIFAMEVGYPISIALALASGIFLPLAAFHLAILAVLGVWYWIDTRDLPQRERVHPAWFLPMAAVMPVIYLLLTPLALFTLDSSSWETRGHQPAAN